MSTAPASAVPIEAPRLVPVFCRPPTSPLCSSGTDDTVTAPSCEASAPDAEPGQQHRPGDDLGPGALPRGPRSATHDAGEEQQRCPTCTTRRGDASGHSLGIPAAARSRVIDSGSRRTPVATADSPSATERNSGMAKNRPAWRRYWKKNDDEPAAQAAVVEHAPGPRSGSAPRVEPPLLPGEEQPRGRAPPPSTSQIDGGEAEPLGRVRASGARTPTRRTGGCRTRSARGRAPRAPVPTRSSRTPLLRLGVGHPPRRARGSRARRAPRRRTPAATTGRW